MRLMTKPRTEKAPERRVPIPETLTSSEFASLLRKGREANAYFAQEFAKKK